MSLVWTIAEQHDGKLKDVSFELLARGRNLADKLNTNLASVLIGYGVDSEELARLTAYGADEIYTIQHPVLADFTCESYSAILQDLIESKSPSIIIASATTMGRTLMPHTAVKVHTGLTADCTELAIEPGTDNLLQTRPAIGGNIMATIKTPDHRPQMATIRPKSNKPLEPDSSRTGEIIDIPVLESQLDTRVNVTGYQKNSKGFVNLEEADIVIAGGRGFKKADNFRMLEETAACFGGVVGATRDAVDRGWISYPHQIGLSGKTISSRLYIGAGISGSIQHLAGIKTCETIVSINSDPEANLHKIADYGIIGDLFDIMPELIKQLGGWISDVDLPMQQNNPAKELSKIRRRPLESPYAKVNETVIEELRAIVGPGNIYIDEERLESYSHDETEAEVFAVMPEVAVLPSSTKEIAQVMKLANRYNIPVTPRGAGSGLSGGAIPSFGGIILSVEKMNSLIELDKENMVAEVEAGMITKEFAQAVQEQGLFYAGYPMSLETCFIGGNIAENAGGGKAVKYGVTGRYIMGLEMVTPTGNIVQLGGKATKDVSGYNLKQLIVGSEGTLGIITRATIQLIGLPKTSSDLLVLFDTVRQAIDSIPVIIKSGIVPTGIEFMDRLSAQTSCRYLNESLPYGNAGAMLLIELDGNNEKQVETDLLAVGDLCIKSGAAQVFVAEDSNTKERIWNVRRNIAEAFKVFSPVQSLEDIVVPPSRIPEMIPVLDRISKEFGIVIPCYGHAGDGNLHATLVKDPEMDNKTWKINEDAALRDIYKITMKLGGKISGEHGIGIKRKGYLNDLIDPVELELMRGIKKAWDPKNILNPGKVFD